VYLTSISAVFSNHQVGGFTVYALQMFALGE